MGKPKNITAPIELTKALRVLLESAPLYQPIRYKGERAWSWPDAITFHCRNCELRATWTRTELEGHNEGITHIAYSCVLCDKSHVAFSMHSAWSVEAQSTTLRKVGQWPAWSIDAPPDVERALPEVARLFYKKGLITIGQNYGLAAVAYFRRVVEEIISVLLDLIEQAAAYDPNSIDQTSLDAVADARTNHQATDKLRLVAERLPPILRVGGVNPLARLYESYSEGVHSLSDEESIDVAMELRSTLDFVLVSLTEQMRRAREYKESVGKIRRRLSKTASTLPGDSNDDDVPA